MKEHRLLQYKAMNTEVAAESASGDESLQHLGFYTRTKESTVGAVKDVLGGTGQLFVKGKRWRGATRIAEGVFNALDIVPSAIADTARSAAGPKSQYGTSGYNYNISRAFGSFKDIEKPTDALGATVDVVHAIGFRAGTDIVRLLRNQGKNASSSTAA